MKSHVFYYLLSLGKVTDIYRFPIKGLTCESLESTILKPSETIRDDRRYALLKENDKKGIFDPESPSWIHKENFLCTFSAPELMVRYSVTFDQSQVLKIYDRLTDKQILPALDLSTDKGRKELADYFSKQANIPLTCVTADKHQFGNTSSSWKKKRDTRCLHIVNKNTISEVSQAIGVELLPTRFRPNIVVDGPKAWSEFDWIDRNIRFGTATLEVLSRTVRCNGISVDPLDPKNVLDLPSLLTQHFPEYGPYLGIYAVVQQEGKIAIGDEIALS